MNKQELQLHEHHSYDDIGLLVQPQRMMTPLFWRPLRKMTSTTDVVVETPRVGAATKKMKINVGTATVLATALLLGFFSQQADFPFCVRATSGSGGPSLLAEDGAAGGPARAAGAHRSIAPDVEEGRAAGPPLHSSGQDDEDGDFSSEDHDSEVAAFVAWHFRSVSGMLKNGNAAAGRRGNKKRKKRSKQEVLAGEGALSAEQNSGRKVVSTKNDWGAFLQAAAVYHASKQPESASQEDGKQPQPASQDEADGGSTTSQDNNSDALLGGSKKYEDDATAPAAAAAQHGGVSEGEEGSGPVQDEIDSGSSTSGEEQFLQRQEFRSHRLGTPGGSPGHQHTTTPTLDHTRPSGVATTPHTATSKAPRVHLHGDISGKTSTEEPWRRGTNQADFQPVRGSSDGRPSYTNRPHPYNPPDSRLRGHAATSAGAAQGAGVRPHTQIGGHVDQPHRPGGAGAVPPGARPQAGRPLVGPQGQHQHLPPTSFPSHTTSPPQGAHLLPAPTASSSTGPAGAPGSRSPVQQKPAGAGSSSGLLEPAGGKQLHPAPPPQQQPAAPPQPPAQPRPPAQIKPAPPPPAQHLPGANPASVPSPPPTSPPPGPPRQHGPPFIPPTPHYEVIGVVELSFVSRGTPTGTWEDAAIFSEEQLKKNGAHLQTRKAIVALKLPGIFDPPIPSGKVKGMDYVVLQSDNRAVFFLDQSAPAVDLQQGLQKQLGAKADGLHVAHMHVKQAAYTWFSSRDANKFQGFPVLDTQNTKDELPAAAPESQETCMRKCTLDVQEEKQGAGAGPPTHHHCIGWAWFEVTSGGAPSQGRCLIVREGENAHAAPPFKTSVDNVIKEEMEKKGGDLKTYCKQDQGTMKETDATTDASANEDHPGADHLQKQHSTCGRHHFGGSHCFCAPAVGSQHQRPQEKTGHYLMKVFFGAHDSKICGWDAQIGSQCRTEDNEPGTCVFDCHSRTAFLGRFSHDLCQCVARPQDAQAAGTVIDEDPYNQKCHGANDGTVFRSTQSAPRTSGTPCGFGSHKAGQCEVKPPKNWRDQLCVNLVDAATLVVNPLAMTKGMQLVWNALSQKQPAIDEINKETATELMAFMHGDGSLLQINPYALQEYRTARTNCNLCITNLGVRSTLCSTFTMRFSFSFCFSLI
ncbi:unnamed protein product [Amoebophrya sp. A120]|nr:unnamed protein product [Amoebophrya sp. A120]|eukprot:GSA120T00013578001.1